MEYSKYSTFGMHVQRTENNLIRLIVAQTLIFNWIAHGLRLRNACIMIWFSLFLYKFEIRGMKIECYVNLSALLALQINRTLMTGDIFSVPFTSECACKQCSIHHTCTYTYDKALVHRTGVVLDRNIVMKCYRFTSVFVRFSFVCFSRFLYKLYDLIFVRETASPLWFITAAALDIITKPLGNLKVNM